MAPEIDIINATVEALNVGGTLTDSFSYQVSDGQGGVASATLTVTIHGTDDAPVAVADAGSATEAGITAGSNATGNVLTNDTDVDNAACRAGGQRGCRRGRHCWRWRLPAAMAADAQRRRQLQLRRQQHRRAVQALNVGGTLTDSFNYTVRTARAA